MTIYQNVKYYADKKGVSVSKLETDLKLSRGSASKWTTSEPSLSTARRLVAYLGVTIDDLYKDNRAVRE